MGGRVWVLPKVSVTGQKETNKEYSYAFGRKRENRKKKSLASMRPSGRERVSSSRRRFKERSYQRRKKQVLNSFEQISHCAGNQSRQRTGILKFDVYATIMPVRAFAKEG